MDGSFDGGVGRGPLLTRRRILLGIGVLVLVAGAIVAYLLTNDSGDAATTTTSTTAPDVVSDSDEVVTEIPQDASLILLEVDGTWSVENDGNVTMSGVQVRDGSDSVICELGTLSPGDRAACEAAAAADGLSAFGLGPQGQEVNVASN